MRLPEEDLERIEEEVESGKYPNRSEAIRDKVRKSFILDAINYMRKATEGLDKEEELERLEEIREEMHGEERSAG